MKVYYNEFEPYAAAWLRNLMAAGLLPPGDVDERSIADVRATDLAGYTQCHFFAGIGGWLLALSLAGWGDRPVWTGSCPCQPFSVAGKQAGHADERDLWPVWFQLIRECRPATVFGEQVANAIGHGWLDRSFVDMESEGYACGAAVLPACGVGAPHKRDRLWFVADAHQSDRCEGREDRGGQLGWTGCDQEARGSGTAADAISGISGRRPVVAQRGPQGRDAAGRSGAQPVGDADDSRSQVGYGVNGHAREECTPVERASGCGGGVVVNPTSVGRREGRPEPEFRGGRDATAGASTSGGNVGDAAAPGEGRRGIRGPGESAGANGERPSGQPAGSSPWADYEWITGADGKSRRVKPGVRLLAHGVPNRVGRLRAYGNAIVPQVAAEFIGAFLDTLEAPGVGDERADRGA